jgi:hypothetical protein
MKTIEKKSERATALFSSQLGTLAAATLVAAAFVLFAGGFTSQAVAQRPPGKATFALGAFTAINGDQVAFVAQKTKSGMLQTGYVVFSYAGGGSSSGRVTCATITSTGSAAIVWSVDHSTIGETGSKAFEVTDAGEPNGVTPGPDTYYDKGTSGDCNVNSQTELPTVRGNVVVSP